MKLRRENKMINLVLSKNEKVVKEYAYGEEKVKGLIAGAVHKKENVKNSLIITNKRIINQTLGPNKVARDEMPIDAAEYVYSSLKKDQKSIVPAIISMVLGLILLIVGLVVKVNILNIVLIILGVLGLVGGIVLLIMWFMSKTAKVEVHISGKTPNTQLLEVSTSSIVTKKIREFKIIVDRDVAAQMVNEIGAIILDTKENK